MTRVAETTVTMSMARRGNATDAACRHLVEHIQREVGPCEIVVISVVKRFGGRIALRALFGWTDELPLVSHLTAAIKEAAYR